MMYHSKPLPTKSSIYTHKNCITNTKSTMRKVMANGPRKARNKSREKIFTLGMYLGAETVSELVYAGIPEHLILFLLAGVAKIGDGERKFTG